MAALAFARLDGGTTFGRIDRAVRTNSTVPNPASVILAPNQTTVPNQTLIPAPEKPERAIREEATARLRNCRLSTNIPNGIEPRRWARDWQATRRPISSAEASKARAATSGTDTRAICHPDVCHKRHRRDDE